MIKMPVWFKIIWMVPIFVNIAALIWFILGSTGGFQRGQDLIETVILIVCGIPSIIILLISLTYIKQGWAPFSRMKYIVSVLLMATLLFFSYQLVEGTPTRGWLYDNVDSDPVRLTSDQKYEYRIDLINPFQRNSREQLHLKNISTGVEKNIPILIRRENSGYSGGEGDNWAWGILKPTKVPNQYELSTLEEGIVGDYNMDPRVFLIDVKAGTTQIIK
ncbi:hypothetical protein P4H61_03310 [Paenibacillus peoriae]|uniref:hypothetical protein n=1 Tax=Paenibacillus peoriae TaxID=59893 RepID=UPI00026C5D91|nr:hypothetical protein [Paenibacillus peoriae]MEC0180524.1 hypothetical protein [Paenibacillus peoriae]